jgi:cytochrome c oxidase cbb3-type subunit 3
MTQKLLAFSVAALLAASAGCNRDPGEIREWRPSDHRHQAESTEPDPESAPQVSGSAEPMMPGLEEVTIAAYRRSCATCHGQLGRGDGPQGPMLQARDLSDPTWQGTVSDAQIAETITKGRGRMPPSGLPPATVDGLVHLVRLFDRARMAKAAAGAAAPPAASGAEPVPSGTAAPSASGSSGVGRNPPSPK